MLPFPRGWTGAEIVFLDCDSTLSTIEGIDELALRRGLDVGALTAGAMAGRIPLESVYRRRLEAIRPTHEDLVWLADRYARTAVPGGRELVEHLRALDIECHVISGGLRPAVVPFALSLGIAPDRVHAVDYPADAPDPVSIACADPLSRDGGKPGVIERVCRDGPPPGRRMLVGDGTSDLEAASVCGLFVGFGGVVERPEVRAAAPVFLTTGSLELLAGLAAGPDRLAELDALAPGIHDQLREEFHSPRRLVIQQP